MLEREKPEAHHQTVGFWLLPTHAKDKNGETPLQIAAYGGFCFGVCFSCWMWKITVTYVYIYIYALRSFIWLSHFLCWLSTTGYFRTARLVIPPCARSSSLRVENGGFGNWICSGVLLAKNQRLIWSLNIKPPWPKPQNFISKYYHHILSSPWPFQHHILCCLTIWSFKPSSQLGSGFTSLVQLLLQHSANVNASDHDNWTPLICAARVGHADVVEWLGWRRCTAWDGWRSWFMGFFGMTGNV